jgi:hypothetical protein
MNAGNKDSCRNLFKKLHILPRQTQYIFSTLMFVVKNKGLFKTNSEVHSFNTRSQYDLHIPTANLTVFQKGVWYSGARICNYLPPALKQFSDDTLKFKAAFLQTPFTWRSIITGNNDLGSCLNIFNSVKINCIYV